MIRGFNKQNKVGLIGELLFLKNHPEWTKKSSNNKWTAFDFYNEKTKEFLEVKSEKYSINETPNIFIEVFSNDKKGTPGGPFRNLEHDFIVHIFLKDKIAFWYNPRQLVEWLDENKLYEDFNSGKNHKIIRNIGYNTRGMAIPRKSVEHLLIKKQQLT